MNKALIDTSILLEPFTPKNVFNYKNKALYLLKCPEKFQIQPVISSSVLGEFEYLIKNKESIRKIKDNEEIKNILDNFYQKCEFVVINRETIELANRILNKDSRLDPLDILHLSCAISGGCKTFLFIDNGIKNSQTINELIKRDFPNFYLSPFNIPKNQD